MTLQYYETTYWFGPFLSIIFPYLEISLIHTYATVLTATVPTNGFIVHTWLYLCVTTLIISVCMLFFFYHHWLHICGCIYMLLSWLYLYGYMLPTQSLTWLIPCQSVFVIVLWSFKLWTILYMACWSYVVLFLLICNSFPFPLKMPSSLFTNLLL